MAPKRKRTMSKKKRRTKRRKKAVSLSAGRLRSAVRAGMRSTFSAAPNNDIFPRPEKEKFVKLRYVTNIVVPTGYIFDVPYNFTFSANGMYAVHTAGGGHQPLGYDQMGIFYTHYRVVGSKITVSGIGYHADGRPYTLGVRTQVDDIDPPNHYNFLEDPDTKSAIGTGTKADIGNVVVSTTYSPEKFFGIESTDSTLSSSTNDNPTREAYYKVNLWPLYNTQSVEDITMVVMIEYAAVFFEPVANLPGS